MFDFEVNDTVIVKQQKALEAALSTSPEAGKILRKIIRDFILQARLEVMEGIKFKHGDPRGAAQAIRTSVYKKVLGANINILNSRKAHGTNSYEPTLKGVSGRGGNRRKRSEKTTRMMKYNPLDRGMILRWLNDGVNDRKIKFEQNERRKIDKWNKHPNTGNRSSIEARHFFKSLGDRALGKMRDELAYVIEDEMTELINKKAK